MYLMMDVEYLNSIEEVGFVVVDEEEICDVEKQIPIECCVLISYHVYIICI